MDPLAVLAADVALGTARMMTKASSALKPLDDADVHLVVAEAVGREVGILLAGALAAAERDEVAREAKRLAWAEVVRRGLEVPAVRTALDGLEPADGDLLRWCYTPLPTGRHPTAADAARRLSDLTGTPHSLGDAARELFRVYAEFRGRVSAGGGPAEDWVFPEPPQLPEFRGARRLPPPPPRSKPLTRDDRWRRLPNR